MNGVRDRDAQDLIILIAHHLSKPSLSNEVDGVNAETCAEDAIECGGSAAALQMTENTAARLLLGASADLRRHLLAHSAEFGTYSAMVLTVLPRSHE